VPAVKPIYYFRDFLPVWNSILQKSAVVMDAQVVENNARVKRSANCYLEGASDVPAAGKNPGQPKEQQDPARATAKVAAPPKGKPAGKTCRRRDGYNHRPQLLGRPVTSAGQRNATPIGVAFSASGTNLVQKM
jgi:hypothetical protein